MAPFANGQLIKVFTVKNNNTITPAGVVRLPVDSSYLSHVRAACLNPARNLMEAADLFLLPSSSSLTSFCPIAQADEQGITLDEYLDSAQTTSIYCGTIDRPPTYTDSKEPFTCDDGLDPVLRIPYVLACWGSANSNNSEYRDAVTSYLTVRLPDTILAENATISCFARTRQNGRRVILSVECPFHDESVLEIGTRKDSKEAYVKSIACESDLYAGTPIYIEDWAHVALVWNATAQAMHLYVNGKLARVTALDKSERIAFIQSTKTWRLALGRGKSAGKTRHGWDGEIADVSIWGRALEGTEIAEVAKHEPERMNPNIKFSVREC